MKFHVKPFVVTSFEFESINIPEKEKFTFQNAIEYIFNVSNVHTLVRNSFYDEKINIDCIEPRFQKKQHNLPVPLNTPFHRMLLSQHYVDSIRLDDLVVDILENRFETRIIILEKNRTTTMPFTLQYLETEANKKFKKFTIILHDTSTMEFFPLKIENKIIHNVLGPIYVNIFK